MVVVVAVFLAEELAFVLALVLTFMVVIVLTFMVVIFLAEEHGVTLRKLPDAVGTMIRTEME